MRICLRYRHSTRGLFYKNLFFPLLHRQALTNFNDFKKKKIRRCASSGDCCTWGITILYLGCDHWTSREFRRSHCAGRQTCQGCYNFLLFVFLSLSLSVLFLCCHLVYFVFFVFPMFTIFHSGKFYVVVIKGPFTNSVTVTVQFFDPSHVASSPTCS